MNIETREITLEPADNARLLALCGPFDDNIKQLERRLGIEINRRDNHFKLTGRAICVHAAADILTSLYVDTAPMRGQIQDIEPEQIHLAIKEARVLEQSAESVPEYGKAINIKTKRGVIKPRTPNQAQYIANILDHDITFGVGPAGTGKTYLAVAAAVDALERQEIRRILLTRPAVEAGEKLGFLPGDLSQKVDPYLRPLYDALFEMLGFEKVEKLMERNVQRTQIRVDLLAEIPRQEAEFLARFHRRTGQQDTANLLTLQRIHRRGDRQVGFTGPRRADAEGDVVVENVGDILRLVWRARLNHPAFGLDINGLAVLRHAFGALLQHPSFFNRQMDLFRLDILNLAAHRGGIHIQATQNVGGGGHANGAPRQFEMVVAAIDFDAQSSLQLFDIVIKRATQAQQTGIVCRLQGNFASVYVQTVPLMSV